MVPNADLQTELAASESSEELIKNRDPRAPEGVWWSLGICPLPQTSVTLVCSQVWGLPKHMTPQVLSCSKKVWKICAYTNGLCSPCMT